MNKQEALKILHALLSAETGPGACLSSEHREAISVAVTALSPPKAPEPRQTRRDVLNARLMCLHWEVSRTLPTVGVSALLKTRYGVTDTRLLSIEQLGDFNTHLEFLLGYKA